MQKSTESRIDELLEHLGMSQLEFANRLGVTTNAVGNWKRREMGGNAVKRITQAFPNVSKDWLLDGTGNVFKDLNEMSTDVISYDKTKGKPYYAVDFELGFDIMENDQTINPEYMIDFAPFNKCDCWCRAYGNSMHPTISNGDFIAIKQIEDPSYLINGDIYAIVTKNKLRTIKRVKDNGSTITLIPDNKDFDEQTIEKHYIDKVYLVMGSVKHF